MNESFSWMLFIIYGLDFVTVLGFAAGMVSAKEPHAFFFLFMCATVFAFYATVFLLPMIKLHEKVRQFCNRRFSRLLGEYLSG